METGEVPNPGLLTSHISLTWEAAAVLSLPRTFPLGIPAPSPGPARYGAVGGLPMAGPTHHVAPGHRSYPGGLAGSVQPQNPNQQGKLHDKPRENTKTLDISLENTLKPAFSSTGLGPRMQNHAQAPVSSQQPWEPSTINPNNASHAHATALGVAQGKLRATQQYLGPGPAPSTSQPQSPKRCCFQSSPQ